MNQIGFQSHQFNGRPSEPSVSTSLLDSLPIPAVTFLFVLAPLWYRVGAYCSHDTSHLCRPIDSKSITSHSCLTAYISIFSHVRYRVFVYADPPDVDMNNGDCLVPASPPVGCVSWHHHSRFDPDHPVDVFIAWRYAASLPLGRSARKSFLWLHDIVPASSLPTR